MPSIPSFLRPKPSPPSPITTFYLSSPSSSSSSFPLRPIPGPSSPSAIPPNTLIFSLTHPPLNTSEATSFFFECIPDPIGFLYHSSSFISKYLSLDTNGEIEWRHQLIQLEFENKDGLAATSGGKIVVSLKWTEDIRKQVRKGDKSMGSAVKEFKGVLLHELVHTIQHDGFSSTPGWLIESIADYVRLKANLGPDHWRESGSGRKENGWEDGYDVGARFLEWLVGGGVGERGGKASGMEYQNTQGFQGSMQSNLQPTPTTTNQPKPTQYPQPLSPGDQAPSIPPNKPSSRPGPFPELIKLIDSRLKYERFHNDWWLEMTGMTLEGLWGEYLRYYGR